MRSAVMHGDEVPRKKLAQLAQNAEFCDMATRRAFDILMKDSRVMSLFGLDERLESYMKDLTLGLKAPPIEA